MYEGRPWVFHSFAVILQTAVSPFQILGRGQGAAGDKQLPLETRLSGLEKNVADRNTTFVNKAFVTKEVGNVQASLVKEIGKLQKRLEVAMRTLDPF